MSRNLTCWGGVFVHFPRNWFHDVTVGPKACSLHHLYPPVNVYIEWRTSMGNNHGFQRSVNVYWRIAILGSAIPAMCGLFKHSYRVYIPTFGGFFPTAQLMGVNTIVIPIKVPSVHQSTTASTRHHPGTSEPRSTALGVAGCARRDRGRSACFFGVWPSINGL